MLKLSAQGSRGNYSSCTGRSNENLCSNSGGAQEKKERQGETEETIKMSFLSFKRPPWRLMSLFCTFLLNLTLCMAKLGKLTLSFPDLSFPDFTDNSIMWQEITGTREPPNSWKVQSRLFCIFCDGTCLFYVFCWVTIFFQFVFFWVCTYKWRYLILRNGEMNILKTMELTSWKSS